MVLRLAQSIMRWVIWSGDDGSRKQRGTRRGEQKTIRRAPRVAPADDENVDNRVATDKVALSTGPSVTPQNRSGDGGVDQVAHSGTPQMIGLGLVDVSDTIENAAPGASRCSVDDEDAAGGSARCAGDTNEG